MTKHKDLLVIAANPVWEESGLASTIELAKHFAHDRHVVFINFPLTWLDALKKKNLKRTKHALGLLPKIRKEKTEQGSVLQVVEPPIMIPTNFLPPGRAFNLLSRWNAKKYARRADQLLRQSYELGRNILINAFNPLYAQPDHFVLRFDQFIYYCYDNMDAAKWLQKHAAKAEKAMVSQADHVVVSSLELMNKFSGQAKSITRISNGMNPSHFQPFASLPSADPHFAYIGALDDRLDYQLIHALLQIPKSKLSLAGPLKCAEAHSLVEHPSCVYHGVLPPSQARKALQNGNIGLIPFKTSEFTKFIYPLKINEYMATGLAVLTTKFAPLGEFIPLVRPVANAQEAIIEVERILNHELNSTQIKKRIHWALQNSWATRAEAFYKLMHE